MSRKVIWSAVLALVALLVGAKLFFTHKYEADFKEYIAQNKDKYSIEYGGFSVCLLSQTATVSDLKVQMVGAPEVYKIHAVKVGAFDNSQETPRFAEVHIEGFEIDFANLDDKGASLQQMGYTSPLLINFGMEYESDADDKTMEIEELSFSADGLGELNASAEFGNLDLSNPEAAKMAAFSMTLNSLEISYVDDGLVRKSMDKPDASGKASREATLQQLDATIAATADATGKESLQVLRKFIQDPTEISIVAKPANPVPAMALIMAMTNPAGLIQTLNMQVK